jgi:hypothetical protein
MTRKRLSLERMIRTLSGIAVLASLVLSQYHCIEWLYITFFLGLSLFQSGLTDWCPLVSVLRLLGIKSICEIYN